MNLASQVASNIHQSFLAFGIWVLDVSRNSGDGNDDRASHMWNPCQQLVVVAWWTLEGVGTALASHTYTVVGSRCTCIVSLPRIGGDMDTSVVSRQSPDA